MVPATDLALVTALHTVRRLIFEAPACSTTRWRLVISEGY